MADNMRIMPDWMYDKAPRLMGDFLDTAKQAVTRPQAVNLAIESSGQLPPDVQRAMTFYRPSPADLVIGATPLGTAEDVQSLAQNGLPRLPATFEKPMMDAMGSDAGKMALTAAAGMTTLMPMMARGGGPKVRAPHQPRVMPNFENEAPSAFRHQAGPAEPMDDPTRMSRMLREQAGSIGSRNDPVVEALPMDEASRSQRMTDLGYERGYYRGGQQVADGDFYTPDSKAAAGFAQRHADAGRPSDVREYALRKGNTFDATKNYSQEELMPLAQTMREYGVSEKNVAQFIDMATDFPELGNKMPGTVVQQVLKTLTGDPLQMIRKNFDSADFGQELIMFNRDKGGVRDENKAVFDPKQKFNPNPFLGVGAGILGTSMYGTNEK